VLHRCPELCEGAGSGESVLGVDIGRKELLGDPKPISAERKRLSKNGVCIGGLVGREVEWSDVSASGVWLRASSGCRRWWSEFGVGIDTSLLRPRLANLSLQSSRRAFKEGSKLIFHKATDLIFRECQECGLLAKWFKGYKYRVNSVPGAKVS